LNLEIARNELGHFIFTEENIKLLEQVKKQSQNGNQPQNIKTEHKKRTEITHQPTHEMIQQEELEIKLQDLETKLYQKADSSIITYQLLQHRREIDDLQEQVHQLTETITQLEQLLEKETAATKENTSADDTLPPRKKKGFFGFLFGS
jgi:chromosome-anchoring protein RacA